MKGHVDVRAAYLEREQNSEQPSSETTTTTGSNSALAAKVFAVLSLVALAYAFLAGLRTLTVTDLGWQLATARWIVQHLQIPSTEIFSYTAQGQPWVYPVGSALLFYGAYLVGNYALLSWLQAAACAGTVALLLRRGSIVSAALAILAVPLIAIRTGARADMFTVVLFAAFLRLLWQHHQTGDARLWLLPMLMAAWVNLHLGFGAGLALMAGYVFVEATEMLWPERRAAAAQRLRASWPWLLAACAATLVNPWGWGIFRAVFDQANAMATLTLWTSEWGSAPLSRAAMSAALALRDPGGAFYQMLVIAAVAVPIAVWRRQLAAALLLAGAAVMAVRHIRFEALFAITVVIVAGTVLTSALAALPGKIKQVTLGPVGGTAAVTVGVALFAVGLACLRSGDLASDRRYLASGDEMGSFGAGLSWWFPERAAAFIERENIPGQIFNSYNDGGYFLWRLGLKYRDYIDGRTLPFGSQLIERNIRLMRTPPESLEWRREAQEYGINAILVPLGRNNGLHLFPGLRQFCAGDTWRPVYIDEVSAVFLRRTPENEELIARLQIQCATAPLPAMTPQGNKTRAFNQWANAAAVLQALGRDAEAFEATKPALGIFPDSAFVHFLRGGLLEQAGDFGAAEQEYLQSAAFEANGATWSRLGAIYHRQGRPAQEIDAWEHASDILPYPFLESLALGYADLAAHRPQRALQAFDKAVDSLPPRSPMAGSIPFLSEVAHGRALTWNALGDRKRAVWYAEETVQLRPQNSDDWLMLANLYDLEHRPEDGQRARARAAALNAGKMPWSGPQTRQ